MIGSKPSCVTTGGSDHCQKVLATFSLQKELKQVPQKLEGHILER